MVLLRNPLYPPLSLPHQTWPLPPWAIPGRAHGPHLDPATWKHRIPVLQATKHDSRAAMGVHGWAAPQVHGLVPEHVLHDSSDMGCSTVDSTTVQNIVIIAIASILQRKSSYIGLQPYEYTS
jgi:hypothetical protein